MRQDDRQAGQNAEKKSQETQTTKRENKEAERKNKHKGDSLLKTPQSDHPENHSLNCFCIKIIC